MNSLYWFLVFNRKKNTFEMFQLCFNGSPSESPLGRGADFGGTGRPSSINISTSQRRVGELRGTPVYIWPFNAFDNAEMWI